jgi:hypothetical protein
VPKQEDVIDGTSRVQDGLGGGAAGDPKEVAVTREWGGRREGTSFSISTPMKPMSPNSLVAAAFSFASSFALWASRLAIGDVS